MRIGIDLGLGKTRRAAGGGAPPVVTPPPPPNPLLADKIVLIGASLMFQSTNQTEEAQYIAAAMANMGYAGVLDNRAVSGHTFADTLALLDSAVLPAYATSGARAFALIHRSGNDVTSDRPYTAAQQAAYRAKLEAITDRLDSVAMPYAACNLSKRFYTPAPAVLWNDPATEVNGAKPYNEACVHPWIAARMPHYWDGAQPWIETYDWIDKARWLVTQNDGIHLISEYTCLFAEYLLYRLKRRHDGDARAAVAGRSFVFNVCAAADNFVTNAVHNNIPKFRSLIHDTAGQLAPHFAVDLSRCGLIQTGGAGAAAVIPDPRLQGAKLQTDYTLCGTTTTVTRYATIEMKMMGLPTGATGHITLTASRSATASDRKAAVTINGTSAGVLDAATNAASNMLVAPFTVPASGEVVVQMAPASGSQFGYLTAWAVDFD